MSPSLHDRLPYYLSILYEINKSYKTYDTHLHPVEIILNSLDYKEIPNEKGLFSLDGGEFVRPSLNGLPNDKDVETIEVLLKDRPEIIPILVRRTYSHTGPKVFKDYFDILGIAKGLMLTVAPANGPVDPQMSVAFKMFKQDIRFSLSGSVPNGVRNQDVASFLREEVEKYGIIAVKIHPGITAINLQTAQGKERTECIIEASAKIGLPVIIHAGPCFLPGKDNSEFALISNLEDINLRSSVPVILAHGGACGLSSSEVFHVVLPVLKKLINTHDNLLIDISGLNYENICLLLGILETERILFGSDALYNNQILILLRLMCALETCKPELRNSLVQILSKNPSKYIFKECPLMD